MKRPIRPDADALSGIGVVCSRFNEDITSRLLESCLKTLESRGIPHERVRVVHVPGGYEIPWAVQELALTGRCAVTIALGAILKGQTPQNEHIARSVIQHLHDVALATRVPCILGVITPNTHAQGLARARGGLDRGREAALAAIEMIDLMKQLRKNSYCPPSAAFLPRGGRKASTPRLLSSPVGGRK